MSNAEKVKFFFNTYSDRNVEGMLALFPLRFTMCCWGKKVKVLFSRQLNGNFILNTVPDFSVNIQQLIEADGGAVIAETI